MTDTATIEALLERLEKVEGARRPNDPLAVGTNWYRNPDGPQAASTIRALLAENEQMRGLIDGLHLELQIARKSYAIGSLTPEQKEVFG